jgi:hypothetical protein
MAMRPFVVAVWTAAVAVLEDDELATVVALPLVDALAFVDVFVDGPAFLSFFSLTFCCTVPENELKSRHKRPWREERTLKKASIFMGYLAASALAFFLPCFAMGVVGGVRKRTGGGGRRRRTGVGRWNLRKSKVLTLDRGQRICHCLRIPDQIN